MSGHESHNPRRFHTGLLTILLLVLFAAGCGFQPRGQVGTIGQLEGSYAVAGVASNSAFYRALRRAILQSGGTWVEQPGAADSLIQVQQLESDSRVLSIDSRNRAVEYELEEVVEYVFRPAQSTQAGEPQSIRVLRILFRPSEAILAADRERDLLREEMRKDLAERVVRRIAARQ